MPTMPANFWNWNQPLDPQSLIPNEDTEAQYQQNADPNSLALMQLLKQRLAAQQAMANRNVTQFSDPMSAYLSAGNQRTMDNLAQAEHVNDNRNALTVKNNNFASPQYGRRIPMPVPQMPDEDPAVADARHQQALAALAQRNATRGPPVERTPQELAAMAGLKEQAAQKQLMLEEARKKLAFARNAMNPNAVAVNADALFGSQQQQGGAPGAPQQASMVEQLKRDPSFWADRNPQSRMMRMYQAQMADRQTTETALGRYADQQKLSQELGSKEKLSQAQIDAMKSEGILDRQSREKIEETRARGLEESRDSPMFKGLPPQARTAWTEIMSLPPEQREFKLREWHKKWDSYQPPVAPPNPTTPGTSTTPTPPANSSSGGASGGWDEDIGASRLYDIGASSPFMSPEDLLHNQASSGPVPQEYVQSVGEALKRRLISQDMLGGELNKTNLTTRGMAPYMRSLMLMNPLLPILESALGDASKLRKRRGFYEQMSGKPVTQPSWLDYITPGM